ncbi:hypothetical protein [Tropicimonas sediminicola]|uniref:Uncharacterized protein n=1 Tax=Tropicimonas sediminicola TaxID=1031541 RepID=A0A239JEV7_9RHOB|nr:hypothetical protein [Tropicimonas sediminicola]SNT04339.1 hypothetical protein SAMN05421757_105243 [Tropicimonas sediminicola]
MPKSKVNTKAINLRIEIEHEDLVRDVISQIRTGGPGFRTALEQLLADESAAQYMPAREIHARFSQLEQRVKALEAAEAREHGGEAS